MTDDEARAVNQVFRRVARRFTVAESTRDDLVQSAWVKFLTGPTFDASREVPYGAWLALLARKAMLDWMRTRPLVGQTRRVRGPAAFVPLPPDTDPNARRFDMPWPDYYSVARVHEALDPRQRAELADLVASGWRRRW